MSKSAFAYKEVSDNEESPTEQVESSAGYAAYQAGQAVQKTVAEAYHKCRNISDQSECRNASHREIYFDSGISPGDSSRSREQMKALAIKEKEKELKAAEEEKAFIRTDIKTRESEAQRLQTAKTTDKATPRKTTGKSARANTVNTKPIEKAQKQTRLKGFQKLQQNNLKTKKLTERIAEAVSKLFGTASKALSSALAAGGGVLVVVLIPLMLLLGCAAFLYGGGSSAAPVSEEVNAYSALIQLYAREHGIPEYTELIKAVMMQESAGRGNDPMQASESAYNTRYPNTPNGITDPEYSINVGIQAVADVLMRAGVQSPIDIENISLALQGYNFGPGYISWAFNNYGGYSRENALEFSQLMAAQMGWTSYGDAQYVDHVLRYYPMSGAVMGGSMALAQVAASQVGSTGGQTYWSWYGYNYRVEWCGCFVSWCAAQCGVLDTQIPKFAYCPYGVNWFVDNGRWQDRSYTPSPGDVIFFDWEKDGITDHVGIVERLENGLIHTVEGNINDSCVQKQYTIGDGCIYGYGLTTLRAVEN